MGESEKAMLLVGGVDVADAQATQKRSVFQSISSSKGIERIEVLRGVQGLCTFPIALMLTGRYCFGGQRWPRKQNTKL